MEVQFLLKPNSEFWKMWKRRSIPSLRRNSKSISEEDISEENSLERYLSSQEETITNFLVKFFEEHLLLSEFYFCRDFQKCRFLKSKAFLAHAHLLYTKYLSDEPHLQLKISSSKRTSIQKKLWTDEDGADSQNLVQGSLFEPIYQICVDRLSKVYHPFVEKFPLEDLFSKVEQLSKRDSQKVGRSPLNMIPSSLNPESWNSKMLVQWIRRIGLSQYASFIQRKKMTGSQLFQLTDQELMDELNMTAFDLDRFKTHRDQLNFT